MKRTPRKLNPRQLARRAELQRIYRRRAREAKMHLYMPVVREPQPWAVILREVNRERVQRGIYTVRAVRA